MHDQPHCTKERYVFDNQTEYSHWFCTEINCSSTGTISPFHILELDNDNHQKFLQLSSFNILVRIHSKIFYRLTNSQIDDNENFLVDSIPMSPSHKTSYYWNQSRNLHWDIYLSCWDLSSGIIVHGVKRSLYDITYIQPYLWLHWQIEARYLCPGKAFLWMCCVLVMGYLRWKYCLQGSKIDINDESVYNQSIKKTCSVLDDLIEPCLRNCYCWAKL